MIDKADRTSCPDRQERQDREDRQDRKGKQDRQEKCDCLLNLTFQEIVLDIFRNSCDVLRYMLGKGFL